jgi:hypothetical protein
LKKWDYLIAQPEVMKMADLQQFISDRGDEGWELVSVVMRKIPVIFKHEPEEGFDQYIMFSNVLSRIVFD